MRRHREPDVDDRLRHPIDPEEEDGYGSSWRRERDGRRYHTGQHSHSRAPDRQPRAPRSQRLLTAATRGGAILPSHGIRGGKAMIATLRRWLISLPGRLIRHGRQLILRLPPGQHVLAEILARLRALPTISRPPPPRPLTRNPETVNPARHPGFEHARARIGSEHG